MENQFSELAKALLSMQKALLGSVVPSLRAVTVDIDINNQIIFFSFFYDGEVSDELFDLASVASAEASSNFPEYYVKDIIKRIDFPNQIPVRGRYAYLRKE